MHSESVCSPWRGDSHPRWPVPECPVPPSLCPPPSPCLWGTSAGPGAHTASTITTVHHVQLSPGYKATENAVYRWAVQYHRNSSFWEARFLVYHLSKQMLIQFMLFKSPFIGQNSSLFRKKQLQSWAVKIYLTLLRQFLLKYYVFYSVSMLKQKPASIENQYYLSKQHKNRQLEVCAVLPSFHNSNKQ